MKSRHKELLELLDTSGAELFALLTRLTLREDVAEELMQELFIKLSRSRGLDKAANQMVRDFCMNNNKILYDFTDIERYDPDGTYFEYAHDNCDYYDAELNRLGNWATEWQNSHVEGMDWYSCSSAHSEPLNANRKAYAAWWLWAKFAPVFSAITRH